MGSGRSEVAAAFARALAAKDRAGLLDVLAPRIDFQGMTPGRTWAATTATELVDDVLLGHWFEPDDVIDELVGVETDEVVDRTRLTYRFAVTNGDGPHLVEQQAYLGVTDGRIDWLRVLCSGFRATGDLP